MRGRCVVHGVVKHLRSRFNTHLDLRTAHADGPRFLQGAVLVA
jgi:hypothetical protein